MKTFRSLPVLLLLLTALSPSAAAYEIDTFLGNPVGWAGNSMTLRLHSSTLPAGNAFAVSLQVMMARWNNNPSNFNFFVFNGDNSVWHGNLQNEAWIATGDSTTPPAECWSWSVTGNIVEADVVFYDNVAWTTSTNKAAIWTYGGLFRPFETAALHELGHALGLNHEADEYNIMGEDWTHIHMNGTTVRSYFGEDAADGTVDIYGTNPNAGQDVSVVHMKRTGRDGEYSLHGFTGMAKSDGTTLKYSTLSTGERRYLVSPGQEVQVELSYENNGRSSQTVDVGFFISTNNFISTADDLFATRSPSLARNSVYTRTYTLTLPDDLVVGDTYWLGAHVDHTRSISELDESNNTAQFPLYIVH